MSADNPLDRMASIEAEQALLGALLINNDVYDRISAIVRAEDFYDPVHSRIFTVIADRILGGAVATPVTVKPFFDDDPGMAELGGPAYLVRLAGAAISLFAAADYARLVAEWSRKRGLYVTLQESAASLVEPEASTEAAIGRVEGWSLAQESRGDGKIVSFMAAVTSALRVAQEARSTGEMPGVKTGIRTLDAIIGSLAPGDLIVLAGRPSMGKTACALQFGMNAARSGHGVGIASLEMTDTQLALRALSEQSAVDGFGVPYQDIRTGHFSDDEFERIAAAAHRIVDLPIKIMPPTVRTTGGVLSACRRIVRLFEAKKISLDLLIIDYLQIMQALSKGNRVEQVTELSGAAKAIAMQLGIPVVVLAQLSRAVESRDDKRPMLSDLRDSGSIEQDADVVIFPFREEYYLRRERPADHETDDLAKWHTALSRVAGRIDLIVDKQRMGALGVARALFDDRMNWLRDEYATPSAPPAAAEGFA